MDIVFQRLQELQDFRVEGNEEEARGFRERLGRTPGQSRTDRSYRTRAKRTRLLGLGRS